MGVVISGWGLERTWHEFDASGQGYGAWLFAEIRAASVRTAHRAEVLIRRLVRRPKSITVQARVAGTAILASRASVRVGYGTLPTDSNAALAELHRRTAELMEKLTTLDERLAEETDSRSAAVADLRARLGAETQRLEGLGRRIATGGIRLQTLGLFLVAFGLLLQGAAFVISWI